MKLPDIERVVCDLFGVERESLQSDCRKQSVSHPRMLAMWLARKFTRAAYAEIGDYFGQRTHSTVISANHKVDELLSGNGKLQVPFGSLPVADAVRRAESRLSAG